MRRELLLVALAALVSADVNALAKWGPTWSEVTGNLYPTARMNRTPAVISQVDGVSKTDRIVKIEPGRHVVIVRSPMRKGFQGTNLTLDLTFEPCKRYYINAQFKNSTGTAWEPVMAMVEPVSGCKVEAPASP